MKQQMLPQLIQTIQPEFVTPEICEDDFEPRGRVSFTMEFVVGNNRKFCPRITLHRPRHRPMSITFEDGFKRPSLARAWQSRAHVAFCRGEPGCPEAYALVRCGRRLFVQMVFDNEVRYFFRERIRDWTPAPPSDFEEFHSI